MDERERQARTHVRSAKKKLPQLFSKEGNLRFHRHRMATENPTFLVDAAREGDPDAIELLREYGKRARGTGETVPRAVHEFVWEYFVDGAPPANRAGTEAKQNGLRDQTIYVLVGMISKTYGFPVFESGEFRGAKGPMTACKIAADALDIGLSYRAIEDIFRERKKSLEARSKRPVN
jgi:hypothetical protein